MNKNILVVVFLLFSTLVFGQFPQRPNPPRALNDFVGVFQSNEAQQLEQKLRQFTHETSSAIVVVVVDDLQGMDRADYTITLAHKWGVGQKGKDNGIMIMVKPTGGQGQRRSFIAVGYGLEGVVPDAVANQIMENEMLPYFKQGDYYHGIEAAVNVLMNITRGEFTAEEYAQKVAERNSKSLGSFIFFGILLFLLVFLNFGRGAYNYSKTNNLGFWAAMLLLMNSGSRSGGYNHFSNGSGGFGGGSGFGGGGGGFGGVGGGGFGGGGAGGSW